jgi:hypothetical protein
VGPRGAYEEGGHYWFLLCVGGVFLVNCIRFCGAFIDGVTNWTLRCTGGVFTLVRMRDEGVG